MGQLISSIPVTESVAQKVDVNHLIDGVYLAVLDFGYKMISKKFLESTVPQLSWENFAPELLI